MKYYQTTGYKIIFKHVDRDKVERICFWKHHFIIERVFEGNVSLEPCNEITAGSYNRIRRLVLKTINS